MTMRLVRRPSHPTTRRPRAPRPISLRLLLPLLALLAFAPAAQAGTLDAVRQAGAVRCGVIENGRGLTEQGATGEWRGLFIDYCRALAAAIFADPGRIVIRPLSTRLRFEALRAGDIDVLMANTTVTMTREVITGVEFPAIYYYDGQGFMAHRSDTADGLRDAGRQSICVLQGTTTEDTLTEYMQANQRQWERIRFRDNAEAFGAFFEHRCDLITTDRMVLLAQRALRAPDPANYTIYPEIISKEPLSPAVRNDDVQWSSLVKWTIFAVITAEEKRITSKNVASFEASAHPEIRRMLGHDPAVNKQLGLDAGWGRQVISGVGNYGEIFERNLGMSSEFRQERGINALWGQGGLIFAPPFL